MRVVTDGRLKELRELRGGGGGGLGGGGEGGETAFSHFLKHLNAARVLNVTSHFCSLGVHSTSCDSVELRVDGRWVGGSNPGLQLCP